MKPYRLALEEKRKRERNKRIPLEAESFTRRKKETGEVQYHCWEHKPGHHEREPIRCLDLRKSKGIPPNAHPFQEDGALHS